MQAEIVTVGTELLLGEILNTNTQFLSRQCARMGIDVFHHVTVGDNFERLAEGLKNALKRADLVLVTGGLGPTPDDITREVVAHVWEKDMVHIPGTRDSADDMRRQRQCMIPEDSIPLDNDAGTAWGFFLSDAQADVACLPGPPAELQSMFDKSLRPLLEDRAPAGRLFSRDILTAGMGESSVASELEDLLREQTDPTIAIYAEEGRVRIRLTTRAEKEKQAEEKLEDTLNQIRQRLDKHIFGYDSDTLSKTVGQLLRDRNETVAVAESCTGGMLGEMFTMVPGASDYFLGGMIAYSNEVKRDLLLVSNKLLCEHGAVSCSVAASMAEGARTQLSSDTAISITGIAGPGGAVPGKPVGTICFGLAGPWGVASERKTFNGNRQYIRKRSVRYALDQLRRHLSRDIQG